jgi:ubiquinone/menaquinone biosynthesis C-methylase UbiE
MKELASTYFVQDKKKKKNELTRLMIQDQMITTAMGGVLPEQADPTAFRHVLDVACGPGGWLVNVAQTYPTIEKLVGVDISQQMTKYARTQAESNHVNDRVEFYVMDALQKLDFPADSFDLVNLRFGLSFLRTWDWPKLLGRLLWVTRPGGVIRLTESEVITQSNSSALTCLCKELQYAFFRAGHFFENENTGLTDHLSRLLNQYGCQSVQTKTYVIEYRAGTTEGKACYEDMKLIFQTLQPFIQKWGNAPHNYKGIYNQALCEMRQPDFFVKWNIHSIWGNKA